MSKKRKADDAMPAEEQAGQSGPSFNPATKNECRASRGAVGCVSSQIGRVSPSDAHAPLMLKTPKEASHLVR